MTILGGVSDACAQPEAGAMRVINTARCMHLTASSTPFALVNPVDQMAEVDVLTNHWYPFFVGIAGKYGLSEQALRDGFQAERG